MNLLLKKGMARHTEYHVILILLVCRIHVYDLTIYNNGNNIPGLGLLLEAYVEKVYIKSYGINIRKTIYIYDHIWQNLSHCLSYSPKSPTSADDQSKFLKFSSTFNLYCLKVRNWLFQV